MKAYYKLTVEGYSVGQTAKGVGEGAIEYTVGSEPSELKALLDAEAQAELFQHFTGMVDATITAKIQAYNKANGVAFANADAFTKYAINTSSQHYAIANQFITWIDNLWAEARTYQATATTVPTDEEFLAVLDAVVF